MSSVQPKRLWASTSFRLALVCAAVIVLAFAVAGLAGWVVTKDAAERASRQRIEAEMHSLIQEIRDEGVAAAEAAIRSRQHDPGALEYLLVGADGAVIAGDLELEPPPAGWSTAYLPNQGDNTSSPDLILLNEAIPGGGYLVIAEDLERTEGVRYAILRTLFWIGAAALVISVGIGFLVARGALRRMEALFSTMERVSAGDLSARAPTGQASGGSDVEALGRRINAMLERIDTLVANLRRVSTDVAHDLRTPLSHVRQELEAALAAPTLDDAKHAAGAASEKLDALMRTFEAILRLAEIEAGAARTRFEPVNLPELMERVADAYRPDLESAGRAFTVEAASLSVIQGDADLLTQALANLLDNAIRHAPGGASVSMRLRAAEGSVRIEVEDDGPGVPEAERQRVLDPFVRLDSSRSAGGAGLGLSIVNAIARLHGARVTMDDAGRGFRVGIEWAASA